MMENQNERSDIVTYIEQRLQTLTREEPPCQRKTFSFEDPHTCLHCKDAFITVVANHPTTVCHDCYWRGVGEPTADGRHRLCGDCGRPYSNDERRTFSATLVHNLSDAISASKDGCALYEWLVDSLVLRVTDRKNWRASEVLHSAASRFQLHAISFALEANTRCVLAARLASTETSTTGSVPRAVELGDLHGWTTATDPAAEYISCRPYERDVKSARSLNFARDCFGECLQNHDRCLPFFTDKVDRENRALGPKKAISRETVNIADIPSRLIDVSSEAGQSRVKLIEIEKVPDETKADVSRSGFAALSYCWGGDQPARLTKASHQNLQAGVHISSLSRTLQDAVWVTQEMGIRYLWIDALCIFQDSDEYKDSEDDKAREIARMATYYGCAIFTICAAAASAAAQGFLHVREPSPYGFGPVRLQLRDSEGGDAGKVYLLEEAKAAPEPTTTRGWTLQESLLSRRILIFAQRQLYWSCVDSFAGCGGASVGLVGSVIGNPSTLVDGIHTMGSLLGRPTENQWDVIVRQYTRRGLSVAADKLLAVSALADSLTRLCAEREEKVRYLAGLLVQTSDPASLLAQLLWYSAGPRTRTKRAVPYRSPSWSWAAVDGPVHFAPVARMMETATLAGVVDFDINVTVPTAPFGSVHGGFLILESRMRPLADLASLPLGHRIADNWNNEQYQSHTAEWIEFFPDTNADGAAIETVLSGAESQPPMFLASLCWRDDWVTGRLIDVTDGAVGLVVAAASDANEEKAFTRVGAFRAVRDRRNARKGDTDPSAEPFNLGSLFSAREHQKLRLV